MQAFVVVFIQNAIIKPTVCEYKLTKITKFEKSLKKLKKSVDKGVF